MKHYLFKINLVIGLLLCSLVLYSQPVLKTKKIVQGVDVYKDFKDPKILYYSPASIKLMKESNGNPSFQLNSYRYTGETFLGDEDKFNFVNYVRFTLIQEEVQASTLGNIKKQTGNNILLKPLTIKNMEVLLLLPILNSTDVYKSKSLGIKDNQQKGVVWKKQMYSIRLNKYESQLLLEQIERFNLAFSIAYTYFVDAIPGKVDNVISQGLDSTALKYLSIVEASDTSVITFPIKSNVVPINIDLNKWEEIINRKEVDIEEGYPIIDIRCYDFKDNYRADLLSKEVILQATTVTNESVQQSFSFEKDIENEFAKLIKFQQAINLNYPLRYKIIEHFTNKHKRVDKGWKTHSSWSELINISTPPEELPYRNKEIKLNVNPKFFQTDSLSSVKVTIEYIYKGDKKKQRIILDELQSRRSLILQIDRNTIPNYWYSWQYVNEKKKYSRKKRLNKYSIYFKEPK